MSKSLAKNSFFNIIYTISNLAYPLITSMYVSRVILTDGVGKVAFVQSIVSYFVTLASLGLPIYGLREVAKNKENKDGLNKLFSELFSINGIATVLAIVIYGLIIFLYEPCKQLINLYLACGLLIVFNFFNVDWFYKGLEEYGYILIRSVVIKVISIIALFIFVKDVNDFVIYALISSIATGSNHIFNLIHAHRYVRFTFKNLKIKRHLVPVFILAGSAFLESIYGKIDVTMLGIMTTDSQVGLYNYAHKTINLVISACTAITTVFMPKLSYYYINDREKFQNILKLGLTVLTFVSLPFMMGILILAPKLMTMLYGAEFSSAGFTLRIFAPLIVIACFSDIICYQLTICIGHEKIRLPAAVIGVLVNVGLNFALIPILSENGATIASVVSELLTNLFLFFMVRRYVQIPFDFKLLLQVILSTLVMVGVVIGICYIPIADTFICIIGFVLGALVYFLINLILRNELCLMLIRNFKNIINKRKAIRGNVIEGHVESSENIDAERISDYDSEGGKSDDM